MGVKIVVMHHGGENEEEEGRRRRARRKTINVVVGVEVICVFFASGKLEALEVSWSAVTLSFILLVYSPQSRRGLSEALDHSGTVVQDPCEGCTVTQSA